MTQSRNPAHTGAPGQPDARHQPPRLPRRALLALPGITMARSALANPLLLDIRRYVFVPSAERPIVEVLDSQTGTFISSIPLGAVPTQVVISRTEAKLAVAGTETAGIDLVDIGNGSRHRIELSHRIGRLVLGTSGTVLAAADHEGGAITLVDLRSERIIGRLSQVPGLRDMMFGDADKTLYAVGDGWGKIGVFDVATAALVAPIAPFRPAPSGIAALARTPDGQRILARASGDGSISVIDPARALATGELTLAGADAVFPSGTGRFLFATDSAREKLSVFASSCMQKPVTLAAGPGLGAVYSSWLDSVAFLPSAKLRRVLVYDLDHLRQAGALPLAGTPVSGSVTADSRTLYLALKDPAGLAVIDGQTRDIRATIPLQSHPLAAIVPGGWGICH